MEAADTLHRSLSYDFRAGDRVDNELPLYDITFIFLSNKKFLNFDRDREGIIEYSNHIADFLYYKDATGLVVCVVSLKSSLRMKLGKKIPNLLQKLLTIKFVTAAEQQYASILYNVILFNVFMVSLSKGHIIMHASAFVADSRVHVLSGSGGVGKTTLSYTALKKFGAEFLADDLVYVDDAGNCYINLMAVHVYPYNGVSYDQVSFDEGTFLRKLGFIHWHFRRLIFGVKAVCRRVPPHRLYTLSKTEELLPIDKLTWLLPKSKGDSYGEGIDAYISHHLAVLRTEFKGAYELIAYNSHFFRFFGIDSIENIEDAENYISKVMKKALLSTKFSILVNDFSKTPEDYCKRILQQ
ncbi:hypothetical protein [Aliidiomarina haloalkalitolerans]|uniref:hypothetical protein n=1 Tax=Aliidiomarina haloalkalitolerans TaxID=859059 RepID=UPI000F897137|nr:hypothetical protein [Aliidiomarina haloalkalitolerans]